MSEDWRAVHPGTRRIIDRTFASREAVELVIAKYRWEGYVPMQLEAIELVSNGVSYGWMFTLTEPTKEG